jgi:aryl-alcohol dehydrogenase-like predicted oxidoreductase
MQYVRLGTSGLIVSRACLGTGNFSDSAASAMMPMVDPQAAGNMIDRALAAGVNFIDTANNYGDAEVMLGRLLGVRRHDVVITTKLGFRSAPPMTHAGLARVNVLQACEASLQRLKTDYIDLYMVHKEDPFTPLEETLEVLNDLVRAGKVRYVGFSNWSAWKAATALQLQKANGWAQFICGQMYYSLLGRDVEHDVVPFMRYAGIGMTVWSPLAGGFLSGKYTRENLHDSGGRYGTVDIFPFEKEFGFGVVEAVRAIARKHGASVAQVSLAWLLSKPVVNSIVVGASKLPQLEDNLAAFDFRLRDEEVAALDTAAAQAPLYPQWYNSQWVDAEHKEALL